MKKIRYFLEYLILKIFIFIFSCLGMQRASNFGGWIGRHIGARLAASRKAIRHMRQSIPEMDEESCKTHVTAMWDNLGRVIAEYPHLAEISEKRVDIKGLENIQPYLKENKPIVFFSGHLANWEIMSACFQRLGIETGVAYRPPNNPYVDKLLNDARLLGDKISTFAKSSKGTRGLVRHLRDGHSLGILIDQKYNEGIAVPFFGQDAKTSTAFIDLAKKFKTPLIPIQLERLDGCNFRVTYHKELDTALPTDTLIRQSHDLLEQWIKQSPGQWIWMHKRWMKK